MSVLVFAREIADQPLRKNCDRNDKLGNAHPAIFSAASTRRANLPGAQEDAKTGKAWSQYDEDRCILAPVNEGARILEEGMALLASDIDVIYLTGYGFPAWRGRTHVLCGYHWPAERRRADPGIRTTPRRRVVDSRPLARAAGGGKQNIVGSIEPEVYLLRYATDCAVKQHNHA